MASTEPSEDAKAQSWLRDPTLPFQRLDEEAIVVDPRTREVHLLNETGARIWELLEEESTVDELVEALADEFEGAAPEVLRNEVESFISDLGGKGLIAPRGRA